MGRGSSKLASASRGTVPAPAPVAEPVLTDEQMQKELDEHFAKVNAILDKFMAAKTGTVLEDFNDDPELDLPHIEKETIKSLTDNYLKEYNSNVENYGDGFEFYDPDQTISILYKNGKVENINPTFTDGSKKIKTTGIDSIIVDSGWGTAFAGKSIEIFNMRETVEYGKYGYRSLKARYDDWDDIRVDFK